MNEDDSNTANSEFCNESDVLLEQLKTNLNLISNHNVGDDQPCCDFEPQVNFYDNLDSIEYVNYQDETQMHDIIRLIQKDLSEPYSIYTYRYFIHNWPQLCFLVIIYFLPV